MFRLLTTSLLRVLRPRLSPRPARKARRFRPEFECLEQRDTPAVTFHGGALLTNVEVEPMYYGLDWAFNTTNLAEVLQFNAFLSKTVNSSYMDMLNSAGYGVGRGTTSASDIFAAKVDNTQFLTDTQIRTALTSEITNGNLRSPDANRLYVVFVEPNVAIEAGTEHSLADFLGYHRAFAYQNQDVHYAVIAFPGGSIPLSTTTNNTVFNGTFPNATIPWLTAFDTMTEAASHELAEAVTDPNASYKTKGWNDDTLGNGGEVGDLANAQVVYLNGYAVQRIADQNEQAMTPMGATSAKPVDFVLKADGTFWVHDQSGFAWRVSNVASISDQGVDNFGQAMVDLVFTNGGAAEYHEGSGLVSLANGNVKQAKAGQGVSYVLMTNGDLFEFKDAGAGPVGSAATYTQLDTNVQSIDAGTDQHGVNMVTEVRTDWRFRVVANTIFRFSQSDGSEISDSTGKHLIASNILSLSAGQQGNMAYVTTSGDAYSYSETGGLWTYLGSGVSAVTAGTDQNGNSMLDMLFANGSLSEWRQGSGWTSLASGNVTSIGKAHAGVLDAVFSAEWAWTHTSAGWMYLTSDVTTAA
jgi:hypothetical protein